MNLRRSIRSLISLQEKSGRFPSLSSQDKSFAKAEESPSVFLTSLIASCLAEARVGSPERPAIDRSLKAALRYIASHKSPEWTWSYLERGAQTSRGSVFPDDLDDTSCALIAIAKGSGKAVGSEALAAFVRCLVLCEEKEGGPYHTWIISQKERSGWRDLDVAVNSNIASFLSMNGVMLPALGAFIDAAIESRCLESLYYKSVISIAYFISRFYLLASIDAERKKRLASVIMSKRNGDAWENDLETALAVTSLLNLGMPASAVAKSVDILSSGADEQGLWKAHPLYVEEVRGKRTFYAGSAALTSAMAIEAISLYQKVAGAAPSAPLKRSATKKAGSLPDAIRREATDKVKKSFLLLEEPASSQASLALKKIEGAERYGPIAALPYLFGESLKKRPDDLRKISVRLGEANLFGWMGYSIQDDIIDGDSDARLLPLSNILTRRSFEIFKSLAHDSPAQSFICGAYDGIDSANAWETAASSLIRTESGFLASLSGLPDYNGMEMLAAKSFGHALGPLTLLMIAGYSADSREFRSIEGFFRYYLIAKQLNDDAHDWDTDLESGRINPISADLIRAFALKNRTKRADMLRVEEILPDLRALFWHRQIAGTVRLILHHAKEARRLFARSGLMRDGSFSNLLLDPLEASARAAAKERSRALSFIEAYEKP